MMKQMDVGQDPKALAAQRLGNGGLTIDYGPLSKNPIPTLVIYGGNDNPDRFNELKGALANGEFKMIAGANHGAAVQFPEFAAGVRDFLDLHSAPAAKLLSGWLTAYNS